MKAYRSPSGIYIELSDVTPVSELLTMVSQRPSSNHTFSNNWFTDPMNPLVCWRLKTEQEIDAEKTQTAEMLLDYKLVIKALARVTWDSVPALKTAFPTYADYQAAIISRYKSLI